MKSLSLLLPLTASLCCGPPADDLDLVRGFRPEDRYFKAGLVSKARAAGEIRILLTDAADATVLQEMYAGHTPGGLDGREGLLIRTWVADPDPGQYHMRWVYGDEHRDYPITVR